MSGANKKVSVKSDNLELEKRVCALPKCQSSFWTMKGSKQSICSRACWEAVFNRPFYKVVLPKAVKYGNKKAEKVKPESKSRKKYKPFVINRK